MVNADMRRVRGRLSAAAAALVLLGAMGASGTRAAGAPAAPAPATAAGFTYIKSLGGIDEYRLDANGLSVLIMPDHSAPVVTFQVTYRVGSRNEVTGTTGATHLLEHMMFKGSERFNDAKGNSIKQYLEHVGGQFNATTSFDRTNYFATLGRDDLDGYVAIESDRMRNLWLRESDRQAEMTVVRNEYERGKNDPNTVLMEEVSAAAYVALPYHHPTIGYKSDIEHVPIEKLRAVLRHVLLAEQCHGQRSGGRTAGRGACARAEVLRRLLTIAAADPADLYRGAGSGRSAPRPGEPPGRARHRGDRVQSAERA